MRIQFTRVAFLPLLVLALSSLSGCVDEKVVYRDRALFEDPPSAAQSFLGYSDQGSKLVVCGNCHVEKQAEWEKTKHANAWEDLQASGHANSSVRALPHRQRQRQYRDGRRGLGRHAATRGIRTCSARPATGRA